MVILSQNWQKITKISCLNNDARFDGIGLTCLNFITSTNFIKSFFLLTKVKVELRNKSIKEMKNPRTIAEHQQMRGKKFI